MSRKIGEKDYSFLVVAITAKRDSCEYDSSWFALKNIGRASEEEWAVMRRFNLWFSLVVLLSMGIGSYYSPDGSFFWLASTDIGAQMVRMGLLLVISVQLFTEPPRHVAIRIFTGLTALATAVWAVYVSTFMNTPIFDTVVWLQTAIALGVSALELPDGDWQETHAIAAETAFMRKV